MSFQEMKSTDWKQKKRGTRRQVLSFQPRRRQSLSTASSKAHHDGVADAIVPTVYSIQSMSLLLATAIEMSNGNNLVVPWKVAEKGQVTFRPPPGRNGNDVDDKEMEETNNAQNNVLEHVRAWDQQNCGTTTTTSLEDDEYNVQTLCTQANLTLQELLSLSMADFDTLSRHVLKNSVARHRRVLHELIRLRRSSDQTTATTTTTRSSSGDEAPVDNVEVNQDEEASGAARWMLCLRNTSPQSLLAEVTARTFLHHRGSGSPLLNNSTTSVKTTAPRPPVVVSPPAKLKRNTSGTLAFYRGNPLKKLPADFVPSKYTVICSKGNAAYNAPGNAHYRMLIKKYFPKYKSTEIKAEKTAIMNSIITTISKKNRGRPAAFVRPAPNGDGWLEINMHQVKEKVGQSFREALIASDPKRHEQYLSRRKVQKNKRLTMEDKDVKCKSK